MTDENTKDDQTAAREASLSAPAGSGTKWLWRVTALRGPDEVKTEEYYTATHITEVIEYLRSEFQDQATQIVSITQLVPVLKDLSPNVEVSHGHPDNQ